MKLLYMDKSALRPLKLNLIIFQFPILNIYVPYNKLCTYFQNIYKQILSHVLSFIFLKTHLYGIKKDYSARISKAGTCTEFQLWTPRYFKIGLFSKIAKKSIAIHLDYPAKCFYLLFTYFAEL